MGKAAKFQGTFLDVLTELFYQVGEHEGHFMFYSLIDLEFGEIRCGQCRLVVCSGTRELIESIWLEVNSVGAE